MEKTKAIIDEKNVTTDWIGEVFDADDYNDEELDNGWWCVVIND